MTLPVFQLEDFSYDINGKTLLDTLSIEIHEHEFFIIVGPNGAGKSTLLKCLNRLNDGGDGRLDLLGKPLSSYKQKKLAQRVGYVPQHMNPTIGLSVYEFVAMSRYPYLGAFGAPAEEHEVAVQQALATSRLEPMVDRALHTLSGGERQRVLIAAALAQETDILLMDEPTTFLDPGQQAEVYQLLSELREERPHLTLIAVTHDVNYAAQAADRILALSEGKQFFCGTPTEFMQEDRLEALYQTPFTLLDHPETGTSIAMPGAVR